MFYKMNIRELLLNIAKGDSEAFKKFYDIFYPRLWRYACYFEMDDALRNDILSDVFMNLWINRAKLPNVNNVESYSYVCIRNQMLKYRTGITMRKNVSISLAENRIDSEQERADRKMEKEDVIRAVQRAIASLPERCRLIYVLIKEEKHSYREVAEMLSISEKTVQAQMIIAVKKLGEEIRSVYNKGDL